MRCLNNDLTSVTSLYKSVEDKHLSRLYENKLSGNKYVLWIIPDLFFKYQCDFLGGYIEINGEVVKFQYKARKPYPNKNIYQISLRNGRRLALGIPLVFDSFEELGKIKQVLIKWVIRYPEVDSEGERSQNVSIINVNYNVSFSKDSKKKVYTLHSYERVIPHLIDINSQEELNKLVTYANEFDTIVTARDIKEVSTESTVEVEVLKGLIAADDDKLQSIIMEDILQEITHKVISNEKINIYYYLFESSEEIKPNKVGNFVHSFL